MAISPWPHPVALYKLDTNRVATGPKTTRLYKVICIELWGNAANGITQQPYHLNPMSSSLRNHTAVNVIMQHVIYTVPVKQQCSHLAMLPCKTILTMWLACLQHNRRKPEGTISFNWTSRMTAWLIGFVWLQSVNAISLFCMPINDPWWDVWRCSFTRGLILVWKYSLVLWVCSYMDVHGCWLM